jgi:hypothetical protein
MKSPEEIKKHLEDRKAELLYILAERNDIFIPQLLLQYVEELRGITKILKEFEEENAIT